jgi:hypothetical protein
MYSWQIPDWPEPTQQERWLAKLRVWVRRLIRGKD